MFVHNVKINFFDCDPAGILFYGRIYEVCHEAYEAMIDSFALKENYWNNKEYIVPIISSSAKYSIPVNFKNTITVEITVSTLKVSSFELSYTCKNEEGHVCVEVKTVHVFIHKTMWKKKELTKEIRKGLQSHFIPS